VGEYYFFKNGLNKGKEFFGKGTPIVNFTDVFNNRGLEAEQLRGKVLLDESEIKNFEVRQGDIFFTRTSETIEEIGYPSVMLDAPETTVFSGFVLRGRAIEDDPLTKIFKRYVFFTAAFRKEMVKKSSMTTRALTSGTAIKEMHFNFPTSKDEQNQIGSFFSTLDRLITLHQREYEKLQKLKKALFEKMFV
jgi:type I restriction enzyme S subunit